MSGSSSGELSPSKAAYPRSFFSFRLPVNDTKQTLRLQCSDFRRQWTVYRRGLCDRFRWTRTSPGSLSRRPGCRNPCPRRDRPKTKSTGQQNGGTEVMMFGKVGGHRSVIRCESYVSIVDGNRYQ